ncbi:hypothetical protein D3C71_1730410 [compost metagenome]
MKLTSNCLPSIRVLCALLLLRLSTSRVRSLLSTRVAALSSSLLKGSRFLPVWFLVSLKSKAMRGGLMMEKLAGVVGASAKLMASTGSFWLLLTRSMAVMALAANRAGERLARSRLLASVFR